MNAHVPHELSTSHTDAIAQLIFELRRLSRRLRATLDDLHAEDDALTSGMRGVLRDLHAGGPQTVPQIARSRPVSRQHIQSLVNKLLETRDVELVPNPAHKRSRLVQLTDSGRQSIQHILARERALLTALDVDASENNIARAAALVREVRDALDAHNTST